MTGRIAEIAHSGQLSNRGVNQYVDDCIFCKIVRGEIPTSRVAESDLALAFDDISRKAPVHTLVIPKSHIAALHEATEQDRDLLADCLLLCNEVARIKGIATSGYQVRVHDGADGGQEVAHLHFTCSAARKIGFGV